MAAEKIKYIDGHLINYSSSNGYPTICINGKNILVHRYVWEKVNGKLPKGMVVHHKDRNRLNFEIENLEVLSAKKHGRHHALENGLGHSNKGKPKTHVSGFCGKARKVFAIKKNISIPFNSISEAAKKLNVDRRDISRILSGKRKHTYGWSFIYGE